MVYWRLLSQSVQQTIVDLVARETHQRSNAQPASGQHDAGVWLAVGVLFLDAV